MVRNPNDRQLSPEDELRLNVLFNTELKAVRIDESNMTLWALTPQGEASVPLKPNERADRYLKRVREMLSGHALGSPGGYPVHLTRWTRQSQAGLSIQHLAQLLLIAEERSGGGGGALARAHRRTRTLRLVVHADPRERAADADARRCVPGQHGAHARPIPGRHLAFLHEDDVGILDTVAVMLVSGVLTDAERLAIWKRGNSRNSYYVAFLELQPDQLPNPRPARADHLGVPHLAGNPYSALLEKALVAQGQTFLATVALVLDRPEIQEVVNHTLDALAQWCAPLRQADEATRNAARAALLGAAPQLKWIVSRSTHWPRWMPTACVRSSSRPLRSAH